MTGDKINILMVDDEPANLLALEATLEKLGQNLIQASSGKEALRHVLNHDFALILLDVQMPGLSGIETATAIRERERSRHIPIIFLTGQTNAADMIFQGYSAGAVDYLFKPLQPDILRAKVEVFVELAIARQRLQQELAERKRIAAEVSKLNEELASKNQQLSRSLEELESYSYSISHDMRAPLRAMRGYSNILLEECQAELSSEHQGFLQKISSGAERLDQLIQDVLSYSILSRNKISLEALDLDKLVREIIEQYPGMQMPDADVQVEGYLPRVRANAAILTQCISNLVGNAIKFVKPGVLPTVRIRAEQKRQRIRLWFCDNGIGIAERDLKRIFGIFVTIHPANAYAGTGIGLSIVRKAAEKMGGDVGVESTLGKGSCFWVELPAEVTK